MSKNDIFSENNQIFENKTNIEFKDLVVAKKDGKLAIFNKENSTFLTKYEYDKIFLSKSGHHIILRADDLIDEEGKLLEHWGPITYSAIIDNYGNIKEYEDLVFGSRYGYFIGDICPVFNKKTNLVHLFDISKEKIISEGFQRISPIKHDIDAQIYFGIYRNQLTNEKDINKILYKDGSIMPLTIDYNNNKFITFSHYTVKELNTLDELINLVKKYGAHILLFANSTFFYHASSVLKVIETLNNNFPEQILFTLELLEKNILYLDFNNMIDYNFNKNNTNNETTIYRINTNKIYDYDINVNLKNRIESNYVKRKIMDFFEKYKKLFNKFS